MKTEKRSKAATPPEIADARDATKPAGSTPLPKIPHLDANDFESRRAYGEALAARREAKRAPADEAFRRARAIENARDAVVQAAKAWAADRLHGQVIITLVDAVKKLTTLEGKSHAQ